MNKVLNELATIKILIARLETNGCVSSNQIRLTDEVDQLVECKKILQKILNKWKQEVMQ